MHDCFVLVRPTCANAHVYVVIDIETIYLQVSYIEQLAIHIFQQLISDIPLCEETVCNETTMWRLKGNKHKIGFVLQFDWWICQIWLRRVCDRGNQHSHTWISAEETPMLFPGLCYLVTNNSNATLWPLLSCNQYSQCRPLASVIL